MNIKKSDSFEARTALVRVIDAHIDRVQSASALLLLDIYSVADPIPICSFEDDGLLAMHFFFHFEKSLAAADDDFDKKILSALANLLQPFGYHLKYRSVQASETVFYIDRHGDLDFYEGFASLRFGREDGNV